MKKVVLIMLSWSMVLVLQIPISIITLQIKMRLNNLHWHASEMNILE
ncbi:hypothetical protein LINPERHAP2_LOCUS10729 [Linum perenne]